MLMCLSIYAQTQTRVTGVVTSANDGSKIMANILVKGTTKGVATNTNGAYVIENVNKDAVLVFSAVGFQTLEVPVNGRISDQYFPAVKRPDFR